MYDSVNKDFIFNKIIFFADDINFKAVSYLLSFIFIIELYKFKSNIVSMEFRINANEELFVFIILLNEIKSIFSSISLLLLILILFSLLLLIIILLLFFLLISLGTVNDFFLEKNSLLIYLLLFIILFILNEELFSFISISGESAFKFIVVFLKKLFISFSALSSSFISLFFPILFKLIFKSSFSINIFCSLISKESDLNNEYILLKCVFNSDHSDKFIHALDKIISSSIIF